MPSRRDTRKPVLAPIAGQLITCALCGVNVKYENGLFKRHLLSIHDTNVQSYFLKYIAPGADKCLCGCGQNVIWTPKTGGRFPDFIRGHHLQPDRTTLNPSFETTPVIAHKNADSLPPPGSAFPDLSPICDGFLNIKKGLYTSLKTGETYAYSSKQDLRFMLALDNDDIKCDSWSKTSITVPVKNAKGNVLRKNPGYEIYRESEVIYVSYLTKKTDLTQSSIDTCNAVSMISGAVCALLSYQTRQDRWFIVWSTVPFSLTGKNKK